MGDVSDISPAKTKIKPGWNGEFTEKCDPFRLDYPLEFITVADSFFTFRERGKDSFWYLRPLSLFETRAIANSFLYILALLKEAGVDECLTYYEKVYSDEDDSKLQDYFFVLNLTSRIYGLADFYSLLKANDYKSFARCPFY